VDSEEVQRIMLTPGNLINELQGYMILWLHRPIINTYKSYFQCKQGAHSMELAKVTVRGQITIPKEIRKKLNIKDGDKVVFLEEEGKIIMENSAMLALRQVQADFRDEAERLGIRE
jgi:antitoxin PrlF